MRKFAISLAAIFSALALAIFLWRVEPLLPGRGATACFAADYDPPRPIDLSSPRRDWKSTAEVKSLRLKIWFPPDERPFRDERAGRGYDWRYSLQLDARLTDGQRLTSSSSCEWTDGSIDRVLPDLYCTIDCDGGSVDVFRKIGQNALSAWFEPGQRLRTGQSCDGGGAVFIGADTEWRGLPTRAVACAE